MNAALVTKRPSIDIRRGPNCGSSRLALALGAGKIFITDVADVIRIRIKERSDSAI
jgi:hypothetical protein